MKIIVYESSVSLEIIATFTSKADLFKWNETHNVNADQIAVNGLQILGWDEL